MRVTLVLVQQRELTLEKQFQASGDGASLDCLSNAWSCGCKSVVLVLQICVSMLSELVHDATYDQLAVAFASCVSQKCFCSDSFGCM